MLYTGDGPCNWSRNHNRCWANDNGTTAGRSRATNGSTPPAPSPIRNANCATVGASNRVRTARVASNDRLIALITRIASIVEDAPDAADAPALDAYTRWLTTAWAVLLVLLGVVNLVLAMIASPDGLLAELGLDAPVTITRTQWSWFANLFNYGIIAGFFVVEFQLRKLRFPGQFTSFAAFLRSLGTLGPSFWRDQLR